MTLWKFFYHKKRLPRKTRARGTAAYQKHKEAARAIILAKLKVLNHPYGVSYGKVAIRNQRTRWGSCSKRGNLNFNYRLIFLPELLIDYVITHELCHLREFSHSPAFWRLVEATIPEFRLRRKMLRNMGIKG